MSLNIGGSRIACYWLCAVYTCTGRAVYNQWLHLKYVSEPLCLSQRTLVIMCLWPLTPAPSEHRQSQSTSSEEKNKKHPKKMSWRCENCPGLPISNDYVIIAPDQPPELRVWLMMQIPGLILMRGLTDNTGWWRAVYLIPQYFDCDRDVGRQGDRNDALRELLNFYLKHVKNWQN